jgi:predicted nucleotidyltransferase component of viral defense system
VLKAETRRLWDFLKEHKALSGFILVGGTALAMHLDHRISEDLDFMIRQPRLPRTRIRALERDAATHGFPFKANDRLQDLEEFEDSGLDLQDYQQNFVVADAVKVTLVAPDDELMPLLRTGALEGPRVASLEEIFRLKCIACANRTKTRDWLDLYVLLDRGLFQPMDIHQTFQLAGVPTKFDIAMSRMCEGKVPPDDEGYQATMAQPPSVARMRKRFVQVRDTIETEVARLKGPRRSR